MARNKKTQCLKKKKVTGDSEEALKSSITVFKSYS